MCTCLHRIDNNYYIKYDTILMLILLLIIITMMILSML